MLPFGLIIPLILFICASCMIYILSQSFSEDFNAYYIRSIDPPLLTL